MNNRKITKGYKTLISSRWNIDTSADKFKDGIIYTLYSDEFNSLKFIRIKGINYSIFEFI